MSIEVKVVANLEDISAIRRCLFPTDDQRGTDSWLQNCLTAVSPTCEFISLARDKKLVTLLGKWDPSSSRNVFSVCHSDVLDISADITAICCLPIASQSKAEVCHDWTCLVVGFSSGYVKFYTDNCSLLASVQLHEDRVVNIKCQTFRRAREDNSFMFHTEELYIMYSNNICVLNGSNLLQILRNNRRELAKVKSKGENLDQTSVLLNPRKWGLVDQTVVNDCAVVGPELTSTFDHLLTASVCGGFNVRYRSVAPHNTLVLGVGAKPYVGFHYALEGGVNTGLGDVAKAVANAIKSALPTWLTGTGSGSQTPPKPATPVEPIACRFGFCDLRRSGDKIILSPDKSLAVVSDSLGRVALIDTHRGVCVRLWKGYREADFAFLTIQEEGPLKRTKSTHKTLLDKSHKTHHRTALFLIIYTPKKGAIDIWVMQQGPKVATFTASKNSKLLYTSHGIVGLDNPSSKTKNSYQFTAIFMDPDGQIKEFFIPFHFALSENNSKRARDLHLVKKLKASLKLEAEDLASFEEKVKNICSELQTNELRGQLIEILINFKKIEPPIVIVAADVFLEKLLAENVDQSDSENQSLITLCKNIIVVTGFYVYAVGDWPEMIDLENGNKDKAKPKLCDTQLCITKKELDSLQRLLDFCCFSIKQQSSPKISFQNEKSYTFHDYLSSFALAQNNKNIRLKEGLNKDKIYTVSETLFKPFILCDFVEANFKEKVVESSIDIIDLINLLLVYWIHRPPVLTKNLESEMHSFSKVLYSICQTVDLDSTCVPYNEISPFWKKIRDILTVSPNAFQSLTAAILCRSVAKKLEHDKELISGDEEVNPEMWEKMSQDNCQWSILIGKLEDVALLNIIVSSRPKVDNCMLPKISYQLEDVSFQYLLQKGKGSVSELVARWLIECGISINVIIKENVAECEVAVPETLENQPECSTQLKYPSNVQADLQISESLSLLKAQFPYSLEDNTLMANICWEYAMSWQKNLENLEYLEAAINCIQAIPNACIRQGTCLLMWSTHLKFLLESTTKLINIVGQCPKERLCRQDTGLSDVQVGTFLKLITEFFSNFLEVIPLAYKSTPITLEHESLWDNDTTTTLASLVTKNVSINYEIVHLHYQLSLMLHMITSLHVKHSKPVTNLFLSTCYSLLFQDLCSTASVQTRSADPKLMESRKQFLFKVINSTIETICIQDGITYANEHIVWMSKCLIIGNSWGLDASVLRCHQVSQLFKNGFDNLATEFLSTISDSNTISSLLLVIAGRRLWSLIWERPDFLAKYGSLSTYLTSHLRHVKTLDDWCAPSTFDGIEALTRLILKVMGEEHPERRLAEDLLESLPYLRD